MVLPTKKPATPLRPEIPRRGLDLPGTNKGRETRSGNEGGDGKQLVVGREISLSGEIKECARLVVEGRVEAALVDGQALEIREGGVFRGPAEVEEAEINGTFDGRLKVRGRLLLRAMGTISGEVRYGELEVERGGKVHGQMAPLDAEDEVKALPNAGPATPAGDASS